jgi:arabinogalactan oligomer/maltooligosaccharide transport system substrate-binding protein
LNCHITWYEYRNDFIWRKTNIFKNNAFLICLVVLTGMIFSACASNSEKATDMPQEITIEPTLVEVPQETEQSLEIEDPGLDLACTISLWHSFNENEIESLLEVSAAYDEIQPDIEFDFLYTPNYDIKNKYEMAAATGGGPSILIGSGEWGLSLYDDSLIQEITQLTDSELLDTVNPAALSTVQYQETLIGLPLNLKGVVMFRNATIVTEAPDSFNELVNLAKSATVGDLIGAYLDYGLFYSGGHLQAVGGSLMDADGNPTFNDEKGIEWLEMLKRYEEAGPIEHNNDNGLNLFLENRVGIIIDDLSNASNLAEAIGIENLVIDSWPSDMSGYVQSDGIYLNANLTGHDLECGWSFMEFLLSAEAQEIFSDPSMAGYIPPVMGLDLVDPLQKQAAAAFAKGTTLPVIPEMRAYWDPVNNALLAVVEFGIDPGEALLAAEEAVLSNISEIREE